MLWQSEGFVAKAPISPRRCRPPTGALAFNRYSHQPLHSSTTTNRKMNAANRAFNDADNHDRDVHMDHDADDSSDSDDAVDSEDDGTTSSGASDGRETPEPTYDVQAILKERVRDGAREFLVRWEGYTQEHDSWEPRENLAGCTTFQQHVANTRTSRHQLVHNMRTTTSTAPHTPWKPNGVRSNCGVSGGAAAMFPPRALGNMAMKTKRALRPPLVGAGSNSSAAAAAVGASNISAGKVLQFHPPPSKGKSRSHIWGQLLSGKFGPHRILAHGSAPAVAAATSDGGSSATATAATTATTATTATNAIAYESVGETAPLLSLSTSEDAPLSLNRSPSTPTTPRTTARRNAHHRGLQLSILGRRRAALQPLAERIAAVSNAAAGAKMTPHPAPAAHADVAGRPAWCNGACHSTNCLCAPH